MNISLSTSGDMAIEATDDFITQGSFKCKKEEYYKSTNYKKYIL